MDESLVKVLLHILSGKRTLDELKEATGFSGHDLKAILKSLENLGWIVRNEKEISLNISVDELADILLENIQRRVVNIPFTSKVYTHKNYRLIRIPQYIVRTFKMGVGYLLVLNINGVRISGTISSSGNFFYVHKRYWNVLGDVEHGKEIDIVLESFYPPEGVGNVAETVEAV